MKVSIILNNEKRANELNKMIKRLTAKIEPKVNIISYKPQKKPHKSMFYDNMRAPRSFINQKLK